MLGVMKRLQLLYGLQKKTRIGSRTHQRLTQGANVGLCHLGDPPNLTIRRYSYSMTKNARQPHTAGMGEGAPNNHNTLQTTLRLLY